jgi:hypothetical protein
VLRIEGSSPLPYLLGDLSQLMIEPLSAAQGGSWTVTSEAGVSVIATFFPFYRYTHSRFQEGVPANETAVYKIQGQTGKLVAIAKHYELTTAAVVAGKPRFEATGDGTLTFDVERGLPASLNFNMRVIVRDANKTEETPFQIKYRLLDEEEVTKIAREAQEAKKEKERPLNNADIEAALADLASADATRVGRSLKLLEEKGPPQTNPKVAKALDTVLLNGELSPLLRTDAAKALKAWSTPESVAALMTALIDDSWPPVKCAAIEAIIKYKPASAIAPI